MFNALSLQPSCLRLLLSDDVVLAADCTAFAVGDFHNRYLKGKSLAIACPKLDEGLDVYIAKLRKYLRPDEKIEIINVHGKGFKLLVNN